MKGFKITKREVKAFFLGILVVLIIDIITNWPNAYNSFIKGFNDTQTEKAK